MMDYEYLYQRFTDINIKNARRGAGEPVTINEIGLAPFPTAHKTPFVPDHLLAKFPRVSDTDFHKDLNLNLDHDGNIKFSRKFTEMLAGRSPALIIKEAKELRKRPIYRPMLILDEIKDSHFTPLAKYYTEGDREYNFPWFRKELKMLKGETRSSQANTTFDLDEKVDRQELLKICPVCEEPATLKCIACGDVSYCSKAHQKNHWKWHRPFCIMYEIEDTGGKEGRNMIARSNIKIGDLILKEYPILYGPTCGDSILNNLTFDVTGLIPEEEEETATSKLGSWTASLLQADTMPLGGPICMGCNVEFSLLELKLKGLDGKCEKCKWNMCSKECLSAPIHALECEYFQENGLEQDKIEEEFMICPRNIVVLRAFLLERKKPLLWEKLMNLEHHLEDRMEYEKKNGIRVNDLYIVHVMKNAFLFEDATREKVYRILGIIDCNAIAGTANLADDSVKNFKNRPKDVGPFQKKFLGIYETVSMINHSCSPNAVAIPLDSPAVEIVATRDIKKGDKITINYDQQMIARGTAERRAILKHIYYFDCGCPMCSDPTENGTMLSAIVCTRCVLQAGKPGAPKEIGFCLPENPLDTSNSSEWNCTCCPFFKTYDQVKNVLIGALGDFEDGKLKEPFSPIRNVLHPNHYLHLFYENHYAQDICIKAMEGNYQIFTPMVDTAVEKLENRISILTPIYSPFDRSVVTAQYYRYILLEVIAERTELAEAKQNLAAKLFGILQNIATAVRDYTKANQLHAYLFYMARIMRLVLSRVHKEWNRRQLIAANKLRRQNVQQMKSKWEDDKLSGYDHGHSPLRLEDVEHDILQFQ